VDSMRIAVLAALNIADEAFRLKNAARAVEDGARRRASALAKQLAAVLGEEPPDLLPPPAAGGYHAADEVPCTVRDGFGSLEPTSLATGSRSRSAVCMPPRRGSLKRRAGVPPGDPVQVTLPHGKGGGPFFLHRCKRKLQSRQRVEPSAVILAPRGL